MRYRIADSAADLVSTDVGLIVRTARKRYRCRADVDAEIRPGSPRAAQRSPDCRLWIEPGSRYVECVWSAAGYQSGERYCPACALVAFDGYLSVVGTDLRTPADWLATAEFAGMRILDPDGWRDGTSMDEPLTRDELVDRLHRCTLEGTTSPPGGGVTHDEALTIDSFQRHADEALTAGGFPRLVEPAPQADPALRDGCYDERTGLVSGGYPPVLAANDRDAGLVDEARVWVAVRRHGVDRHALAPHSDAQGRPYTLCSRSTRTGELLPAGDPWVVASTKQCPRCWPGGGV